MWAVARVSTKGSLTDWMSKLMVSSCWTPKASVTVMVKDSAPWQWCWRIGPIEVFAALPALGRVPCNGVLAVMGPLVASKSASLALVPEKVSSSSGVAG